MSRMHASPDADQLVDSLVRVRFGGLARCACVWRGRGTGAAHFVTLWRWRRALHLIYWLGVRRRRRTRDALLYADGLVAPRRAVRTLFFLCIFRREVILLGDSAVGKTKMVERYMDDDFNPRQLSTCVRDSARARRCRRRATAVRLSPPRRERRFIAAAPRITICVELQSPWSGASRETRDGPSHPRRHLSARGPSSYWGAVAGAA